MKEQGLSVAISRAGEPRQGRLGAASRKAQDVVPGATALLMEA